MKYFFLLLIISGMAAMAAENNVEEAVRVAMSGSLNPDHIGPDRATQFQTILSTNATTANNIALSMLSTRSPGFAVEEMHVTEIVKFTGADVRGASQLLRAYITHLDSSDAAEKSRHASATATDSENEQFKNRTQRIEATRKRAIALLKKVEK
jgi:hypothetical protein